jgi:hypothetical protein
VRATFAEVWAALDDKERAIGHYRAAFDLPDAGIDLHALEHLASLEIRWGSELCKTGDDENRKRGGNICRRALSGCNGC